MIRVITEDSKDRFYESDKVIELKNARIDYENKMIFYDGEFNYASMWFSEIVKIEKQVKDLTLEECEKLGLEPVYHITDDRLIYVKKKGHQKSSPWELDDYIDITSLVKGGETNDTLEHN